MVAKLYSPCAVTFTEF